MALPVPLNALNFFNNWRNWNYIYLRSQRYEWYISLALWEWTFISVPTMKESHLCCSRHRSVINDVSNTKCLWVILRETSKLCPSSIIQKRIIMSGHLVPIWVVWCFSITSIYISMENEFLYGLGSFDIVWKYHFLACPDIDLSDKWCVHLGLLGPLLKGMTTYLIEMVLENKANISLSYRNIINQNYRWFNVCPLILCQLCYTERIWICCGGEWSNHIYFEGDI